MTTTLSQVSTQQVVDAVRRACNSPHEAVLLHGPSLRGNELAYLKDCIETEWVSTGGAYVMEFERRLARFTGAKHAVAAVNGTCALHAALLAIGVRPGDEVLVPSLTFVASANAISYCGATPHFVDAEALTFGVDPDRLDEYLKEVVRPHQGECINRQTGHRISAIVPVHALGHPVRMDRLMEVARHWGLPVVEDAAESLGSYYHGTHTGRAGVLGVLSFNSNKVVTTGGGGAIITDDSALAERIKHLTTTAKTPHPWEFIHDTIGFNYRMPNLNAAVGCAQMERLPGFLLRKRDLATRYVRELAKIDGITVLVEPPGARSNYWLNALILAPELAPRRDELLQALNNAELQCRPLWRPMHQLPMYKHCPRMDLHVTEDLSRRTINAPSGTALISR